jgi:cobalt-zinc-cadmium efflux system membrane fusion protein
MSRRTRIALARGTLGLALVLLLGSCGSGSVPDETPAPAAQPPPAAQPAADWCAGHGLPESKCTKCNPELIEKFKAAGDWCEEHGFPESVCPVCNPVTPPEGATSAKIAPGTRIRFRSPELERATGIETEPAHAAPLGVGVECTARIEFDQNRLADIRASFPGVVREVRVDLGQRVAADAALFVLDSAEVADLQGRLRAARERVDVARSNHERQLELREPKIASARQVEQAREELETAEAELRSLEASLRIAGASGIDAEGRFVVRSPVAGTVVRRPATIGTFAGSDVSLATVADTSRMWALLEVRESDADRLRNGQAVVVRIETLAGREFAGELTWIASEVDTRTRTVDARAEVENPDGLLRAEQFARATIEVASPETALVVPRRAVQQVGEELVVFVRTEQGVYEPRVVSLGRSNREVVEVRGALRDGDAVVTEGAFLLKTELSPESIGAGCCEVEPAGKS